MTTMVEDIDLPPGVRLDPRRGRIGGQTGRGDSMTRICPKCDYLQTWAHGWIRSGKCLW